MKRAKICKPDEILDEARGECIPNTVSAEKFRFTILMVFVGFVMVAGLFLWLWIQPESDTRSLTSFVGDGKLLAIFMVLLGIGTIGFGIFLFVSPRVRKLIVGIGSVLTAVIGFVIGSISVIVPFPGSAAFGATIIALSTALITAGFGVVASPRFRFILTIIMTIIGIIFVILGIIIAFG